MALSESMLKVASVTLSVHDAKPTDAAASYTGPPAPCLGSSIHKNRESIFMKLAQMALHIDELDNGTYYWRILGCGCGGITFEEVLKVGTSKADH